jgi:hypothetical protein
VKIGARLNAGVLALAGCAIALSIGCAPGPVPLFAQADGVVALLSDAGAAFTAQIPLALAGLAVLALVLGGVLTRAGGFSRAASSGLLLALGLAFAAQAVLPRYALLGIGLYFAAAAVAHFAKLDASPAARGPLRAGPLALELVAVVAALALYALLAAWRLDVRPELDFDEFAYLKAALIAGGDLPITERIGRVSALARF